MTSYEDRLSRLEGMYQHLATKEDIANLRGEFQASIAGLRGELQASIAGLRGEFQASIEKQKTDLIKWMVPLVIGSSLGTIAALAAIIKFLG